MIPTRPSSSPRSHSRLALIRAFAAGMLSMALVSVLRDNLAGSYERSLSILVHPTDHHQPEMSHNDKSRDLIASTKNTTVRTDDSINSHSSNTSSPSESPSSSPSESPSSSPSPSPSESTPATTSRSSWCPSTAPCHNTDLCHPCQRKYLIIIASGRSASTTLTWMLDTLPGMRMSGENYNTLGQMMQMHSNLWSKKMFWKKSSTHKQNAFGHHPVPPQTFACAVAAIVQAFNPPRLLHNDTTLDAQMRHDEPDTIVGFKTIRFHSSEDNIPRMIDFVKKNLPCSKIIVNINSNVTRQAMSQNTVFEGGAIVTPQRLQQGNQKLIQIQQEFGDEQAYLLDSNQWTRDVTILNRALDWLGFRQECHFADVLGFNTHGFRHSKTQLKRPLHPECRPSSLIK